MDHTFALMLRAARRERLYRREHEHVMAIYALMRYGISNGRFTAATLQRVNIADRYTTAVQEEIGEGLRIFAGIPTHSVVRLGAAHVVSSSSRPKCAHRR